MKTYLVITVMGCLLLAQSGCASPPQVQVQTPFSVSDFEPYKVKGQGKIYGQAFLKTSGGEMKIGAGDTVSLWPNPPFMKEVISFKDQGDSISNYNTVMVQQIRPYIRESVCDAQGNYEFTDLPPGDYFLEVSVTWLAGNQRSGEMIRKPVTLGEGQVVKVMLTP